MQENFKAQVGYKKTSGFSIGIPKYRKVYVEDIEIQEGYKRNNGKVFFPWWCQVSFIFVFYGCSGFDQ